MATSCKTTSTLIIEVPPCGTQFNINTANGTLEENLMQSTECNIVQEVDVVNLAVGRKMPNHYKVLNRDGDAFLDVQEESDSCERACFRNNRELFLQMYDMRGQRVMSVHRPNKCCWGRPILNVEYPAGSEMAYIEMSNACMCCVCCSQKFFNIDSVSAPPMHIVGPGGCCPDEGSDAIYNVGFAYKCLH